MQRAAACAVVFGVASCAGARHRKVAGPPPEYERPVDPEALAEDGGAGVVPSDGATGEPASRMPQARAVDGSGAEFMLVSPDARR